MAKHYRYVNGKKLIVVNNYDLGTDVIPDEGEPIVPDPTVSDAGKILQVNNAGNLVYADPPEELPSLTGNAGKVLKVASGASGVEWAAETSDLPAVTIDDAGDVLTVNASGEWEAAAPSGGGLTLYGPYIAKGPDEIVTFESGGNIQSAVPLDVIEDYRTYESVMLPLEDAVYLIAGVKVPNLLTYAGNTCPMFYDDGEEQSVSDYEIYITNLTSSDISVYANQLGVIFYSSVELPVVQSEEE